MKLRYEGTCRVCGAYLPVGTDAIYERATRSVRCVDCVPSPTEVIEDPALLTAEDEVPALETGVAGSSARREHERRRTSDEERLREKWGPLGGFAVALSDERQATRVWKQGAIGEERLGARLDELASENVAVLHDRRIPRTRANIDHLVITTGGVWVVDAKRYVEKRPELRVEGGILRPRVEKLLVGRRDQTKLVDGVLGQVALVRDVVDVGVVGALCFVEADWPLFSRGFAIRSVHVVSPRRIVKLISESTGVVDVPTTARRLAERFPPA
jgi:hypothetical protein